jgi:hypothetical protein
MFWSLGCWAWNSLPLNENWCELLWSVKEGCCVQYMLIALLLLPIKYKLLSELCVCHAYIRWEPVTILIKILKLRYQLWIEQSWRLHHGVVLCVLTRAHAKRKKNRMENIWMKKGLLYFFYFRHTHTFCSKREHTIYITLHMIFYILKEATIDFP